MVGGVRQIEEKEEEEEDWESGGQRGLCEEIKECEKDGFTVA